MPIVSRQRSLPPDFEAKMHQTRFRLGLRPRPRWGVYNAPRDSLAGFHGPTYKGKGGRGDDIGEERGEVMEEKEGNGD